MTTVNAGQRILADHHNSQNFLGGVLLSSQALTTSSTTLQDLVGALALVEIGTYRWEIKLSYESASNTPDIKVAMTFPATSSTSYTYVALATAATGSPPYSLNMAGGTLTTATAFLTAGTVALRASAIAYGHFVFTAAGTVQLQAAQNTSDATAVTVHPGSYLELIPIG